jgi:serine/threonine protein kinase/formylglycine-generating enzyme required for sulfatase activity
VTLVNSSGAMALVGPAWVPPNEFDEFRIVRSLGIGSMGQVYLAHDLLLERPVAVKFVHTGKDPEARARLIEEARAIARLQHPNVVAIYRVADFAGHPYLVSEYVQGRALHQLDRPMPSRKVLDIALDLTRGLAAAHRRGVLHRDIKPANAILTDDGRAKLLDFGLAVIMDSTRGVPSAMPARAAAARVAASVAGEAPLLGEQTMARQRAVRPTTPGTPPIKVDPDPDPDPTTSRSESLPVDTERNRDSTTSHSEMDPYMVGTPMYMAPEVWRGEPATRRSDLYSLGILLYELLAGATPFRDVGIHELPNVVQQRVIPRLGDISSGVDPAFAAVVDRLIERDPRDRFRSAEALLLALEECAAPSLIDTHPDGNPYRGLAAFESAHASLFFGRRGEARELIDRVRVEAFVVVGGDSGTGKSSLCKAAVLPSLSDNDGWSCVEVVPGRHPLRALAAVLAPWADTDEGALADLLRESPDGFARAIRKHIVGERSRAGESGEPAAERPVAPRRLLLFVDQLEELLTLAEPDEARTVATALAALAVRSPWVRVLTTARSDFLSRLAMLPGLGEEIAQNLYFLRPLTGEHIREVIVRPAAAKGVVYESEALIDTLVAQTEHAPGGLPLLQFTLAELWDSRDLNARTIRAEALAALGGVEGSLTRHADRFLGGLGDDERDAARRILLRLVTAEGTRTRRTEPELVTEGPAREAERAALEVLVRGRLLVANNAQDGAYEIAHEALLSSWSTLQGWLQRDAANHAVHERVEQAASAWERSGRLGDLLWGRRQLVDARALDRALLTQTEAAFLTASGRAIRRQRVIAIGAAAMLVIGAVSVGLAIRAKARREVESMVADQTRAATEAQRTALQTGIELDEARKRALALFDEHRWNDGEQAWTGVEEMALREEREYRAAFSHLETVLLVDPQRAGLRGWAADLMFARLVRAEHNRRRDLVDEFASRVLAYDDGRYKIELGADATVQLSLSPETTQVWIERDGAPRAPVDRNQSAALSLSPGSLVLVFEAPGHVPARLPVLLARSETLQVRVALPRVESAPAGMIYVPPGRFLFGSEDGYGARRGFFNAAPLHEVSTGGYFIGRYEVTFGEWIEFLDDLPPDERRKRSPQTSLQSTFKLTELGPGQWKLTMAPSEHTYTAQTGERLRYLGRKLRADQDWTRFPVSAVSFEDAIAYAEWLDRTRRLPGARLCDDYEWERAARGADGRIYPSGNLLAPDDANIDVTYGREPLGFGPDEVGSHPRSRSPVGADDMAGNVWEWARSVQTPGMPVIRGGSWYLAEISARSMNREHGEPTMHNSSVGVRLCVTEH